MFVRFVTINGVMVVFMVGCACRAGRGRVVRDVVLGVVGHGSRSSHMGGGLQS